MVWGSEWLEVLFQCNTFSTHETAKTDSLLKGYAYVFIYSLSLNVPLTH